MTTTRDRVPAGAPAWTDLATTDVAAGTAFYTQLFGWTVTEPDPALGGYLRFALDGVDVAGVSPAMTSLPADVWTVHFAVDDAEKAARVVAEAGGTVVAPVMDVAGLLDLAVVTDPQGAAFGLMTLKAHPGALVTNVPGAVSHTELLTRDFATVVGFYERVLGADTVVAADSDDFRYTQGWVDGAMAFGIMDGTAFLPDGTPSAWATYWQVADVAATIDRVTDLGGAVVVPAMDTPYGVLATLADTTGATFKVQQP